MPTIKISEETYTKLGNHVNGFETPESVILRLLKYFDDHSAEDLPIINDSKLLQDRSKNYSKYQFEGELFGKGRLVLAVVNSFCSQNNAITFEELKEYFPDHLQGSLGVFKSIDEAQNIIDRSPKNHKRHYVNSEEIIKLVDADIAICTEWGIGNINNFIEQAISLGFEIELK